MTSSIRDAFYAAKRDNRCALVVYLTCGDPSAATSIDMMLACEAAGADVIELGVPYSDPTADGPVIQNAMDRALAAGMSLRGALESLRNARAAGLTVPVVLFGYFNPIFQYGINAFCADAKSAGASGLLTVDLPGEEIAELADSATEHGLDVVPLIAPTSRERIEPLRQRAWGFVYCVARTGVTGSGAGDEAFNDALVAHAREVTEAPLAIGFGIRTGQDVARYVNTFDGVVVGSALIEAAHAATDPAAACTKLVGELRSACGKKVG